MVSIYNCLIPYIVYQLSIDMNSKHYSIMSIQFLRVCLDIYLSLSHSILISPQLNQANRVYCIAYLIFKIINKMIFLFINIFLKKTHLLSIFYILTKFRVIKHFILVNKMIYLSESQKNI